MHDTDTTELSASTGACCKSSRRNRFFRRKQMRTEEFETEQRYLIGRRRLINRAVLGWGVVNGFALSEPHAAHALEPEHHPHHAEHHGPPPKPLSVGAGLALDPCGREIVLAEPATLSSSNTFVLLKGAGGCQIRPLEKCEPGRYVLAVHYAELRVGDANVGDACGCEMPEKRFVCETAIFSLCAIPDERCPCAEGACDRECRCEHRDSCNHVPGSRHSCLCQWTTGTEAPCDESALCEWRGRWISLTDAVGLACVTVALTDDRCEPVVVDRVVDACGPRRLVKSNDLLYDLVRGCDLTHITEVSWAEWHRSLKPMPWSTFAHLFGPGHDGSRQRDAATHFTVEFSRPVRIDSLRFDVVVMTVILFEQATGWRGARRVPIRRLEPFPPRPGEHLPPGTTKGLQVHVRGAWIEDEIKEGGESWLTERDFTVEIEIRGDLIVDCHGLPVDANSRGVEATPTGDGVPGGTFLSSFRVEEKPSHGESDEDSNSDDDDRRARGRE